MRSARKAERLRVVRPASSAYSGPGTHVNDAQHHDASAASHQRFVIANFGLRGINRKRQVTTYAQATAQYYYNHCNMIMMMLMT